MIARYPEPACPHMGLYLSYPDPAIVAALAKARDRRANNPETRMDPNDLHRENRVGGAMELANSDETGYPMQQWDKVDPGFDFPTPAGLVDTKGAAKFPHSVIVRLSQLEKHVAQIYVLGHVVELQYVLVLGWCRAEAVWEFGTPWKGQGQFEKQPALALKCSHESFRPIKELWALITPKTIAQIRAGEHHPFDKPPAPRCWCVRCNPSLNQWPSDPRAQYRSAIAEGE